MPLRPLAEGEEFTPVAKFRALSSDEEFTPIDPVGNTEPEGNTAFSLGLAAPSGFNQGLANMVGAPVDLMSAGLRLVGVPVGDSPIGGSDSIASGLRALGISTGETSLKEKLRRELTPEERVLARATQEVGAAALPIGATLGAARRAASVLPATSTAQQVGRAIVNPTRAAPATVAGADVGISAASGAAAGTAAELLPDDATPGTKTAVEMAAQFTPFLILPVLGSMVRGLFRGGDRGAESLNNAIDDFAAAGASPSVGQGTGSTVRQGVESTVGRLPGGASVMRNAAEETSRNIGNSVNALADNLARNVDPEQAGRAVVRGLTGEGDTFLGRFNDTSDQLYRALDNAVARDTPVSVDNTQRAFADLASPVQGAEELSQALLINPTIARAAQAFAVDANTGVLPYHALREVRSRIGRLLATPSLVDDAPRAQMNRLYAAISADLEAAAASAGPRATRAFNRANRYYRAGIARIENVIEPLVQGRVPERVFNALQGAAKEGPTTVRTIYRSLNAQERATVTSLVLRRMGHATPGNQGAEGLEFSVNTFLTNWNKIPPASKEVLFSQPGFNNMRRDLDAIARTAERIRAGSQVLANPSGTSDATAQVAGAASIGVGAAQAAQGNFELLAGVLTGMAATNSGARLMTNPRFVRWLARGTEIPAREIPLHISRLTNAIQNSEMGAEAVDALNAGFPR